MGQDKAGEGSVAVNLYLNLLFGWNLYQYYYYFKEESSLIKAQKLDCTMQNVKLMESLKIFPQTVVFAMPGRAVEWNLVHSRHSVNIC